MNLLDKRKLGVLLWLAPFLFACESEDILSLPKEPGDQTLNLYFTEIPLPFSLVQVDSVSTRRASESGYHMLAGSHQDDVFGQVQTRSFTEITLGSKAEVTSEDQYDSLVMILVNDYFYGDAAMAGSQTIGIYPLADTLEWKAYYNNDQADYLPTALGELTFTPDPEATSSADTFRIALNDAFGQELFDLAKTDASALKTDSAFREYFPGIALVSSTPNQAVTGFDPNRMAIVLYFSTSDETTSSTYTFGVSNRASTFNNISVDRSGTPLAGFTTPNQEMMADDGKFYLQSGTGLIPKLSLQPVLDYIEDVEDSTDASLRINRIDLYVGTTQQEEGQPLPQAIYAFGFNEDYTVKVDTVVDAFGRVSYPPRGLFLDNSQSTAASPIQPDESQYQARITTYFSTLIGGAPNREIEFIIRPHPTQLGNTLNQIVAEPDSIIAKVYYTLLE